MASFLTKKKPHNCIMAFETLHQWCAGLDLHQLRGTIKFPGIFESCLISCWWLEIGDGGSIYIREIGKCCKSRTFIIILSPLIEGLSH